MSKIFLRTFFLALLFILMKPPKTDAQPCPMWVYNNGQTVGLVNDQVYNTFVEGDYIISLINTDFGTGQVCFSPQGLVLHVSKTPAMSSVIAGAPPAGRGIYFTFPPSPCNGTDPLPNLHLNSTSITITALPGGGLPILAVDYTDNNPDFCDYTVLPVTFGSFSTALLSSPTRVRLYWSTYTEQDVSHFSVEKSINGSAWYKIGQVTAVGNSTSQNFYQYDDNYPSSNGYYRIASIDLDCSREYTAVRRVTCSTCSATFNSPLAPGDCPPPQPYLYVSGPSSICDNSQKVYRLLGLKGEATITWSLSPSNLATLTPVSRLVGITPTGTPGIGTLTATVVKNGVTSNYSTNITFGVPVLSVWGSTTPPTTCQNGQFTATVSMFPGTHPFQYSWYQGGSFIGTGDHHTWILTSVGQVIFYEVRWNGPCGTSVIYGASGGIIDKGSPKVEPNYQVAPNPARTNIVLTRKLICPIDPPPFPLKTSSPKSTLVANSQAVMVKVFDINGNLRKTARVNVTDTKVEIRTGDLQPGMYYVHIIEPGMKEETLKVWLVK